MASDPTAPMRPARLVGISPGAQGRWQNPSQAQSSIDRPLRVRAFSEEKA